MKISVHTASIPSPSFEPFYYVNIEPEGTSWSVSSDAEHDRRGRDCEETAEGVKVGLLAGRDILRYRCEGKH